MKRAFQARHKEVGEKFDKEVLPKIYVDQRAAYMKQLEAEVKEFNRPERTASSRTAASQLLAKMKETSTSRLTPAQIRDEISALQGHFGIPNNKGGVTPLPVEKLFQQYRPQLDQYYEKHGLGEGALQKEYVNHGLTQQNKNQIYNQMVRDLGLDQGPF